MEMANQYSWDGYVDWRGKPASRSNHGGMLAVTFVLVAEVFENLAFLANASNLVLYFTEHMHFTPSQSANSVTNFMGTAFLLALVGGFLSDAFFTAYQIFLVAALTEFLGLVILTVQAHFGSLQPSKCDPGIQCRQVHGAKAAMLFSGLYLVALGVGGIKGSLPAQGAEQLDESTPQGRKQRSTFFNYFVFSLSGGALIAVTLVVWIEDNKGWEWGFGISTLAILLSASAFLSGSKFYRNKIPLGSPLTTIFKVLVASVVNRCTPPNMNNAVTSLPSTSPSPLLQAEAPSQSLKFLNRAVLNEPAFEVLRCNVRNVEDVKVVMKILPIFASTIILNACLAQLSTFSVQQAATMDTNLGSFKVPPASLPIFPVVFIMVLAPVYDHYIIPFARRATKSEAGVTHLQRIGVGLVLSIVAMAVAGLVEVKRKGVARREGMVEAEGGLPVTFLWIGLQYLFLGSADLFTLAGLLEFFFTEAPAGMRSLATALSWASLAMGYYLSTAIVSAVNGATGERPWLSGRNLNYYHLERFYWLMCGLSGVNLVHYLIWASRYKYVSHGTSK